MSNRLQQINGEIHRELAKLIPTLKDPRISGVVSLVRVDTTRDLSFCKVYVSAILNAQGTNTKEVIAGLISASGFLRHEIGQNLGLRHTPKLTFVADQSIETGAHISGIIEKLNK